MQLNVYKKHPNAKLPTRGSPFAAGYDLFPLEPIVLYDGERRMIDTGIAVGPIQCVAPLCGLPPPYYIRIAPRSGLALKGVDVCAGVVDQDYTGEIKVILHNRSKLPVLIEQDKAIAQMIFELIHTPKLQFADGEPPKTERGAGGFGSTDKKPKEKTTFTCKDCGATRSISAPAFLDSAGGACLTCGSKNVSIKPEFMNDTRAYPPETVHCSDSKTPQAALESPNRAGNSLFCKNCTTYRLLPGPAFLYSGQFVCTNCNSKDVQIC